MLFDDPKKELKLLEQQLLAAEMAPPEEDIDGFSDEIYEEFSDEFSFEEENELPLYGRAAGFDAEVEEEEYYMDESRYAAPPKKKGFRGLVIFALLQAIVIIALVTWWLGQQL